MNLFAFLQKKKLVAYNGVNLIFFYRVYHSERGLDNNLDQYVDKRKRDLFGMKIRKRLRIDLNSIVSVSSD